jgi:RNA polymerase sigma factor (sigma-70 family)
MAETHDSRSLPGSAGLLLRSASDERLARLAGRGNARAFAVLYERHQQPLYRLCLSIVRVPEDARDALQSTFERAFAALRTREREIAVRPWLFRIAHNESISVLRRRRPGEALPEDELPSLQTVEGAVEERARLSALVADIHSLPARQRSVLLMRELSGLSIAEIAAAMSMSSAAVKQTLFEARGSLHAYAEGRAMACEDVRRAISDGDRRALRARKLRAHLRDCAACAEFNALISAREADLRALAPSLPAAAAATALASLLAHGTRAHAGAAAGSPALVAAKHAASSVVLKSVAGVAVTAAVGAGAAQLISHHTAHARPPAHVGAAGAGTQVRHAGGTPAASASPSERTGSRGSRGRPRSRGAQLAAPLATAAPALGSSALEPGQSRPRGAAVRAHGSPAHAHRSHTRRPHSKPTHRKPTHRKASPTHPPTSHKPPKAPTGSRAAPGVTSAHAQQRSATGPTTTAPSE